MNVGARPSKPVCQRPRASKRVSTKPPHTTPVLDLDRAPEGSCDPDYDVLSGLPSPALSAPPSSERIRARSRQTNQARVSDKHLSQQTMSSYGSSSQSGASQDRTSWETSPEEPTTSGHSSAAGKPAASSMAARDRPESVQIFGKTLFGRRAKGKKEDGAQSSSESLTCPAAQTPSDTLVPLAGRDTSSTLPSIFGRRKAEDATAPRKLQISGPYNFQHLTHAERDHLVGLDPQRLSHALSTSDLTNPRPSPVLSGRTGASPVSSMHSAGYSSERLPLSTEDLRGQLEQHVPAHVHYSSSMASGSRKPAPPPLRKTHSRSQEAFRVPPPRPPRSPIQQTLASAAAPVPPPRSSSRPPLDRSKALLPSAPPPDRPKTGHSSSSGSSSPPHSRHGALSFSASDLVAEISMMNPFLNSPVLRDANWPLPCPAGPALCGTLPNLPEEDEAPSFSPRSRTSIISNSSLRGSQSVPMLRKYALQQADQSGRRPSAASETLGRADVAIIERTLSEAPKEDASLEAVLGETWEDCIDYCYEHAAEADCDYEWERPSCDLMRDEDIIPMAWDRTCNLPSLYIPHQQEVPALSPTSQVSTTFTHEAMTPIILAKPKSSDNFSLPRLDSAKRLQLFRDSADLTSYRESQGFPLSPELLIPNDFQQQMAADELYAHFQDSSLTTVDESFHFVQPRSSASTMTSHDSSHLGFGRHASTTSSDLTRLTMSTTSLDSVCISPTTVPTELDESRHSLPTLAENVGSEPNLQTLQGDEAYRRKDWGETRRSRTRTASLPTVPAKFALFPTVPTAGPRI